MSEQNWVFGAFAATALILILLPVMLVLLSARSMNSKLLADQEGLDGAVSKVFMAAPHSLSLLSLDVGRVLPSGIPRSSAARALIESGFSCKDTDASHAYCTREHFTGNCSDDWSVDLSFNVAGLISSTSASKMAHCL